MDYFSEQVDAVKKQIRVAIFVIIIICDWILENRPNCHTWPIPFYRPS